MYFGSSPLPRVNDAVERVRGQAEGSVHQHEHAWRCTTATVPSFLLLMAVTTIGDPNARFVEDRLDQHGAAEHAGQAQGQVV